MNEDEDDEYDWTEIAWEERMAKKVKKGEIAQLELDTEFMHHVVIGPPTLR